MPARKRNRLLFQRLTTAVLALALSAMPVTNGLGQETSGEGGGHHSHTPGDPRISAVASPATTASIVRNIQAVRAECASYDPVYRIDCLRRGLKDVADRIPGVGDYRQAKRIIAQAASKLGGIHANNADASQPRVRTRGNARFKRQRTLTAVKRQNLRQAMQQAAAVIEEAETLLLRSAENSQKRSSHYQQIAAAVGSTKVLLRSA